MRHGTQPRACAAALAVAVAALGLTGCGQSKEQWAAFVDTIASVPGVQVLYQGVSTPLPFTVQGTLEVSMPAEGDVWAEVVKVACETDAGASVHWEVTVVEGRGSVRTSVNDACPEVAADLSVLAASTAPAAPDCALGYDEGDDEVELTLSDNCGEAWVELLPALAPHLAPVAVATLSSSGLSASVAIGELPAMVRMLSALRSFDVTRVEQGDVLLIETERIEDEASLRDLVTELAPTELAALDVVVDAPGGPAIDSRSDPAATVLAETLIAEFPTVTDVEVRGDAVWLVAPDPETVESVINGGPALDPGDVPVRITMVWSEGHPAFASDVSGFVLTEDSPYPLFWQQYERLAQLDDVRGVEFGGSYLDVAIEDILDQESAGFLEVRELVEEFDETEQYDWYSIGKYYVERE